MSHEIRLSRAAARALAEELPKPVAAAAWGFIRGDLAEQPWRVGKPLRYEAEGLLSARRGAYRIIYRIRRDPAVGEILRIAHRGDAYRN